MNKLLHVIAVISVCVLAAFTGCTSGDDEHTLIPVEDRGILQGEQEAPDDIMPVPGGGPAYRANVHQTGEENPWPSIEITEAVLGSGSDEARVYYREFIETEAGAIRNNIIKVFMPDKEVESISLYADEVPEGIGLADGMHWSGPRAGAAVLVIEITAEVMPGEYRLDIGLLINGRDYGTLPCTVRVIDSGDADYSGLGLTEEESHMLEERGIANVDSAETASIIAGFQVALPSYVPEGFRPGKFMVSLSGAGLPEELKPKFNNNQVHRTYTWEENGEIMILLIQAVHKSGIGGGEAAEICGQPGERRFTKADPQQGREYDTLSIAWEISGSYFIINATLGGPLDEAEVEKVACSISLD